jgi:hypothetical protein
MTEVSWPKYHRILEERELACEPLRRFERTLPGVYSYEVQWAKAEIPAKEPRRYGY